MEHQLTHHVRRSAGDAGHAVDPVHSAHSVHSAHAHGTGATGRRRGRGGGMARQGVAAAAGAEIEAGRVVEQARGGRGVARMPQFGAAVDVDGIAPQPGDAALGPQLGLGTHARRASRDECFP